MDRSRGPALVSPLPQAKPEAPKLRRKLQKNVGKYRNSQTKRPGSGASNEIPAEAKCDPVVNKLIAQGQPALPLPPDLSDSKWLEYIRKSGFICSLDSSAQSNESLNIPVSIIPELSHLALDDAKPRGSLDSLKPPSDSPKSSTSTMMRRRAKTPVLRIGQLEGVAPEPTPSIPTNKVSSVELIAEQYRALLRSRNSMFFDSHSEPPPSRQEEHDEPQCRANSSEELRTAEHLDVPVLDLPNGSPTSDDGTLVAFEEETVYFKPVSFSPEPLSPVHIHEHPILRPPTPAPDNLSLQICLDLLSRELSSAICDRPFRSPSDVPALQIWVMIEAYERLRDQVMNMRLRPDELRPLDTMFDMWLRALYNVHDKLTEGRRSSESDYDALESEDLD